jgi:hypothetical protein
LPLTELMAAKTQVNKADFPKIPIRQRKPATLQAMARVATQTMQDLGFEMATPQERTWATFLVMQFWAMTDSGQFVPSPEEIEQAINMAIGADAVLQWPGGAAK